MAKRPCCLDISGAFDREEKQPETNEEFEDVIQSCLNVVIAKVCEQFKDEKKAKKVRFDEGAKKHDGPELSTQIAEFVIYNYFEKPRISCYNDIKRLLVKRYGHIDIQTLRGAKSLLNDMTGRLEKIPSYMVHSSISLFRRSMGTRGLKLGKRHESHLKKLVGMYIASMYMP